VTTHGCRLIGVLTLAALSTACNGRDDWSEGDPCKDHPYARGLPAPEDVAGYRFESSACGPNSIAFRYAKGDEAVDISILGAPVTGDTPELVRSLGRKGLEMAVGLADGTARTYRSLVEAAADDPSISAIYGGPDYLPVIIPNVYREDFIAIPVPMRQVRDATQDAHSTQWTIGRRYVYSFGITSDQPARGQSTARLVLDPFLAEMDFAALP